MGGDGVAVEDGERRNRSPQTATSKVSTGASKRLYQARLRTAAFSQKAVAGGRRSWGVTAWQYPKGGLRNRGLSWSYCVGIIAKSCQNLKK